MKGMISSLRCAPTGALRFNETNRFIEIFRRRNQSQDRQREKVGIWNEDFLSSCEQRLHGASVVKCAALRVGVQSRG
jgi:hypothetical protein